MRWLVIAIERRARKKATKNKRDNFRDGSRNVASFLFFLCFFLARFTLKIIDWKVFSWCYLSLYFPLVMWSSNFKSLGFCIVLSGILNSNRKNHLSFANETEFDSLNRIEYQVSNIPIIVHDSFVCSVCFDLPHSHPLLKCQLTSAQIDFRKFVFKLGDA